MASGGAQDEGLGYLQDFVALLEDTRHGLAERQALMDARADALAEQAASSASRLQTFQEAVTGMAEAFATVSQAMASDLGHLARVSSELGEQLRGPASESLQDCQDRFTATTEGSRLALDRAATEIGDSFGEVEQAVEQGDERAAALGDEEEAGFGELAAAVSEADSSYTQGDFELQGALEATTAYLLEGLEQYLATVFDALFDHLENELPPYVTGVLQELGRDAHRALDDYDGVVQAVSEEMSAEGEQVMGECVRALREAHDDRLDDRRVSFGEMRALLQETERSGSVVGHGAEVCSAYPPIVPQLAAAREVADRVQEMMDVFNPFGSA